MYVKGGLFSISIPIPWSLLSISITHTLGPSVTEGLDDKLCPEVRRQMGIRYFSSDSILIVTGSVCVLCNVMGALFCLAITITIALSCFDTFGPEFSQANMMDGRWLGQSTAKVS